MNAKNIEGLLKLRLQTHHNAGTEVHRYCHRANAGHPRPRCCYAFASARISSMRYFYIFTVHFSASSS